MGSENWLIPFARKIRIVVSPPSQYSVPTMSLTNMTFLNTSANAILAEDATTAMSSARANSTKPDRDRQIKQQPNDGRPSDDRLNEDQCWAAVAERDSSHDGKFVFAVATTGVYCRPSCPARRPRRENVAFFARPELAEQAGFRACLRCRPQLLSGNAQSDTVKAICRYIEQHLDEAIPLQRLGKAFRQSPFHLQRRFKAVLGITPREYADSCRMRLLKRNLQVGDNVTRAMYDAGYGSSSRLYEKTASQLGMTPDKYRRGAIAAAIRYACADSPLGRMLIAATDRGICTIQFARSDGELIEGLKREFPFAARKPDEGGLQAWIAAVLSKMTGKELNSTLPLDIRATAFQRRVWTYLQSIPFGATRSYSDVAKAIGQPSASRAVARACATNPVAVAIPCHRVVREDGNISGYRWGVERKKTLLELEQSVVET
jgi:AraC family transcriptional regulator, regulatory protein of adaptative response / methylated-DNA-[protein]-cysteine methyltransferase